MSSEVESSARNLLDALRREIGTEDGQAGFTRLEGQRLSSKLDTQNTKLTSVLFILALAVALVIATYGLHFMLTWRLISFDTCGATTD